MSAILTQKKKNRYRHQPKKKTDRSASFPSFRPSFLLQAVTDTLTHILVYLHTDLPTYALRPLHTYLRTYYLVTYLPTYLFT